MNVELHTCGAPGSKHPVSGYSEGGACLEALKASRVMTICEWPACGTRVRKLHLGHTFCRAHDADQHGAFMGIVKLEGPSSLNRPIPTLAERVEFWETGKLPASRLTPVTFENTKIFCGLCGDGLIVHNDPDWSPDLPNSMSCRYTEPGNAASAVPWGIPICRCCSFRGCRHCLFHGVMVDGHTPDASGNCTRCGRTGA
jgi:hypothetical protein